jgi:hypothetical protein
MGTGKKGEKDRYEGKRRRRKGFRKWRENEMEEKFVRYLADELLSSKCPPLPASLLAAEGDQLE